MSDPKYCEFCQVPGMTLEHYKQQLDTANKRIAEADYERERLTACVASLESQLASSRAAKEAAERKLATAREAMRVSYALLDSKSRNADRIEETLRQAEKEIQALAQIEQPQSEDGLLVSESDTGPTPRPGGWSNKAFGMKDDEIEQPQSTPAEHEEPRQPLPGEDSDETCLCSVCVALRGKAKPCSD